MDGSQSRRRVTHLHPLSALNKPSVRCAIYTRRSVDEDLDREFTSLDAQREIAMAFINSRSSEGWVALPQRYDDGGYSGATLKRPALQRLIADIERGAVDCVVAYKIDRLTRSLVGFARLIETFHRHGVGFVAVTQQLDTTNSVGRLALHVLLSFAQFERRMIGDRVRDSLAAARRKGKWIGGPPVLGYDLDPRTRRLIVNDHEAERVRAIFELYLEHRTARAVAQELRRRGWRSKRHVSKRGTVHGDKPFTERALYYLLNHVVYIGKAKHNGAIRPAGHEAIVDEGIWQRAQELLRSNAHAGRAQRTNKHGALLRGLLYCDACGSAMRHVTSGTTRPGKSQTYRYYSCVDNHIRVRRECPTRSVSAAQLEAVVVQHIRSLVATLPDVAKSLRRARQRMARHMARIESSRQSRLEELNKLNGEMARLIELLDWLRSKGKQGAKRLDALHEQADAVERRTGAVRAELLPLHREAVDAKSAGKAFLLFGRAWDSLDRRGQWQVMRRAIERVGYDGRTRKVTVSFREPVAAALSRKLSVFAAGLESLSGSY